MTEPTHTPLPWTFEAGVEDNEGEFYVCHAGTVCTETTVCNPRSEADARLIVHAVNSHHDLIEALREELVWHEDHDKAISKQPNANTGDNGWRRMEHQERIAALTAILTKAEACHG